MQAKNDMEQERRESSPNCVCVWLCRAPQGCSAPPDDRIEQVLGRLLFVSTETLHGVQPDHMAGSRVWSKKGSDTLVVQGKAHCAGSEDSCRILQGASHTSSVCCHAEGPCTDHKTAPAMLTSWLLLPTHSSLAAENKAPPSKPAVLPCRLQFWHREPRKGTVNASAPPEPRAELCCNTASTRD